MADSGLMVGRVSVSVWLPYVYSTSEGLVSGERADAEAEHRCRPNNACYDFSEPTTTRAGVPLNFPHDATATKTDNRRPLLKSFPNLIAIDLP